MLDPRRIATGIFTERKITAADRDADITHAESFLHREGLLEESLPILGAHPHQVVAAGTGEGGAKAVNRLEYVAFVQRDNVCVSGLFG